MFKTGDKIIAKTNFLLEKGIPYEKRELTIAEYDKDRYYVKLTHNDEFVISGNGFLTSEYFYFTNNINHEIFRMIEDDNIEFKSFSGVTVDGKVIQIENT